MGSERVLLLRVWQRCHQDLNQRALEKDEADPLRLLSNRCRAHLHEGA